MKNLIFHLTFLGLCMAAFYSCTNPIDTGAGLLDEDLVNVQNVDTFKITGTTVQGDSLQVYSIPTSSSSGLISRYFFGKLNDPIFGITDAMIQTQLVPVIQASPGANVKIDSLVLVLPYSNSFLYGNKAQKFDLEIKELADSFTLDKAYFSNQKLAAKTKALYSKSFAPSFDSIKINDFSFGTKTEIKVASQLRVRFDDMNEFAGRLIGIDTAIYKSRTKFLQTFFGLQFRATNSGTGLAAFDVANARAGLYLYYQDASLVQREFKYAFGFVVGSSITRDRGTSLLGKYLNAAPAQEYILIQGQEGSNGKFSIPGLKNLKNIIVNKAELVLTVASVEGDETSVFAPSPRLLAMYRNNNGIKVVVRDFDIATQSSSIDRVYDGLYKSGLNNEPGTYTINLTNHVQDIIAGKVPEDMFIKAFPLAESAARTTLYRANHPVYGAKLKLYYTQLKP